MTTPKAQLSDWMLERLAQGELPASLALDAQKRLLAEPDGAARLAALQADDDAFLASPMARSTRSAILSAAGKAQAPKRARPWLPLAFSVMAAACVLIAFLPGLVRDDERDGRDTRVKGLPPTLAVYRHQGREVERLADGAVARPGDEIQLGYSAAGRTYGAILSIDGRGAVTLHFPDRPDGAAAELRLAQPNANAIGPVPLARALALDDAPEFERFFFVTSRRPFALGAVLSAAEALTHDSNAVAQPLRLPSGLEQTSVLLRKATP
jgi:hypothetical protein